MIIHGDKIAYPINRSTIRCVRSDGVCEFEQVYLTAPDENSWAQNFVLSIGGRETFTIASWTKDTIETIPTGTSGDCRQSSLSLNFANKEFFYVTKSGTGDCKLPLGGKLDRLSGPRIAQVVDGATPIDAAYDAIERQAYEALSSDLRAELERATAATPK